MSHGSKPVRSGQRPAPGSVRRLLLSLFALAALATAWAWAQSGAPAASSGAGTTNEEERLETFVPTEDVAADQAVDFPVDI